MSYDIWLYIPVDTGATEPQTWTFDVGNHSSNVAGIWRAALGDSLSTLDGWVAGNCIEPLEKAIGYMRAPSNIPSLKAMEPANGWGTYGSALVYLEKFLNACRAHPKCRVKMSY